MSVSRPGERSRRRKGGVSAKARRDALKDAIPDVQHPASIKRILEDEEHAAESDEDDD